MYKLLAIISLAIASQQALTLVTPWAQYISTVSDVFQYPDLFTPK